MEEQKEINIGRYLKRLREEKQLTLQQVSDRTCIHEKFLVNIEKEIFDDMGGVGYSKAMIMSYARALGADEKLILQRFNSKFQKKVIPHSRSSHHRQKKIMIPTSLIYIIIMIIIVVIVGFVISNLYRNGDLNFSLRKQISEGKSSKVDFLEQPVKKTVSIYDSLEEEKKAEQKPLEEKKKVKLDMNALQDTTDYTDRFLFEGEESPYNVKE